MTQVLKSWRNSADVPKNWVPAGPPGAVVKVRVNNAQVLKALRAALPGVWHKVYHLGRDGSEVHYFQHASGAVANVKYKRSKR